MLELLAQHIRLPAFTGLCHHSLYVMTTLQIFSLRAVPTNSDVHFFELPHFCSLFSRVSSQGPTWEAVSIKLKFPGEECPRTFLAPKFSEAWCAHYLWKLLYMCLSRLCTTIPKYKMEIGLITPSICARDKVICRFILLSLSVSHSVGKKKNTSSPDPLPSSPAFAPLSTTSRLVMSGWNF